MNPFWRGVLQGLGRVARMAPPPELSPTLKAMHAVSVPPPIPPHIIVAGTMDACRLWCMENERSWRDPHITLAVSGTDVLRSIRGRKADTLTVVFVYGHGRDRTWGEAYEYVHMMQAMGATVVWHES